jgi:hypothetical protein
MIKIVLCKMAVDGTKLILGAIYQISEKIIANIGNVFTGGGSLTPCRYRKHQKSY